MSGALAVAVALRNSRRERVFARFPTLSKTKKVPLPPVPLPVQLPVVLLGGHLCRSIYISVLGHDISVLGVYISVQGTQDIYVR